MALWDIAGKRADRPVHTLLGGLERDYVPFYWYLPAADRSPTQAVEEALAGIERGFDTIYIKVGFDLPDDLAITRAVREAIGERPALRVDANEGWSLHEAIHALVGLEPLALEFCEQPIDMHDIAGLADLRARTRVPIGANQAAWLDHNVLDVLARRAADVIVTDPHQLGGLSVFRDAAAACEIAGIPVVKHSFGDLGITTAATLQVLGTLPEPALAHQTHLELLEHDLLMESFVFQQGSLRVPDRAGIGVELDGDAHVHYQRLYEEIGEFSGYAALDAPSPLGTSRSQR
jgi:L-alanine-DL-glutamate epimerase-like enolase superfamily enzyme